jgi:hypothetical protein
LSAEFRHDRLERSDLEQIAGERNVRRRESALQNKELEHLQADTQPEDAPATKSGSLRTCRTGGELRFTAKRRFTAALTHFAG